MAENKLVITPYEGRPWEESPESKQAKRDSQKAHVKALQDGFHRFDLEPEGSDSEPDEDEDDDEDSE